MIEMLQYTFMQRAFLSGVLLAVITPFIGITIVLKRMSMIGDALSHASLAGVAAGLLLGINPVLGACIICVIAAFGIEGIRKKFLRYSEIAIAIMMSTGIGLAGVLSGYVKSNANFNSFLFGSIVSISKEELILICLISIGVLIVLICFYREFLYIAFDENAARISGVPVRTLNFIFTLLTALTVSVASRTVGTLIISSMLVVPIACGMQLGKSYFHTLICAIAIAVITTIIGLILSFYIGVKPGGAIVLLEVICFILSIFFKNIMK